MNGVAIGFGVLVVFAMFVEAVREVFAAHKVDRAGQSGIGFATPLAGGGGRKAPQTVLPAPSSVVVLPQVPGGAVSPAADGPAPHFDYKPAVDRLVEGDGL